jgi:hypothetical protein
MHRALKQSGAQYCHFSVLNKRRIEDLMKKRHLIFVSMALMCAGISSFPAQADTPPSIVIIDSGISDSVFASSIVTEACFLEYGNCPNGKATMDGPGAANLPKTTNAAFDHGSFMQSIVLRINPSARIIPIRTIGMTEAGNPYIYSLKSVKMALDWVVANRATYNITAVNISEGKVFPGCAVPAGLAEDIAALKAAGTVVIAATGNDSNRTAMMSPACLPDVISVGATDNPDPGISGKPWDPKAKPYIGRYSNGNAQTTFYTNARFYVTKLDGSTKFMVGTSNASTAMTGWWTLNYKGNYADTLAALKASATTTSNEWLKGSYIFIPSAK